MTSTLRKLERVQLTDTKVKVEMSQKILDQIKYLCRAIPKVEWSGVLFYSTKGSIKDPENMVCVLEEILPMHKGTASYTEYEFDESVLEFMMENETMEKGWKMGHIHSHNSMGVFFSGTDWSELEDNAPNHNIYLSLIVNNWMDFCAKVCFIAEAKESKDFNFICKDENGESYVHSTKTYNVEDKQLVSYDCNIITPKDVISTTDTFQTKVAEIIKKAEPKVTSYTGWNRQSSVVGGHTVGFHTRRGVGSPPNHTTSQNTGREVKKGEDEYPSFDFRQRDFSTKSTEISPKITGGADIVEFAMFVLLKGDDISQHADVEDVVAYLEEFKINGIELAKDILQVYSSLYEKYFKGSTDTTNSLLFVATTEAIIEEYTHEVSMSMDPYLGAVLRPVIEGLRKLVMNFNKTIV